MKMNMSDKCLACGEKMQFWGKVGEYNISVCPKCGFGKTDNPTIQGSGYHRDAVYQQESEQFKNIFQRRIKLINSLNLKPGRVLEVGSSTGLLLSILKEKGWKVTGVEISSEAARYAERRGVSTLQIPIEELNLPLKSFDLIIANHTLEHLQNPEEVLQKIHELLRDGGILLIDVPNFGGFSARIFKKSWFALLPQEHLWHFTFDSLSRILKLSGFEVINHTSPSGVFDYGDPTKELWQSFIGFKKRFFTNMVTLLPNLLITLLNDGATLTVLAKAKK